jgi:hypothetical protein
MPKWEINLNNATFTSQVKQYEQLEEPFGFTTDTTVSHVEPPRRKEMIEKVSDLLRKEIDGDGNRFKDANFHDNFHVLDDGKRNEHLYDFLYFPKFVFSSDCIAEDRKR